MEVNLPFLLCFTLYLRAIFQVQLPGGAYIWRGDLTEGFLRYRFGGLIFGGAYICRSLFSQFYGTSEQKKIEFKPRMKLNHNITHIFLWFVYGNYWITSPSL